MRRTIAGLTAPAYAGVVRETSTRAAIGQIKNCLYDGATMIDLHLPCLEHTDVENLRKITKSCKLPILALNYNKTYEGCDAALTEEERVDTMLRALEAGAAGMDMQGYTFHLPSKNAFCGEDNYSFTKGNPKEVVTDSHIIDMQCDLIRRVHAMDKEVLLSCHPGIFMNCQQVVELALFLEKRNPDVIKIVTSNADTEEEMAEVFRTMIALKKEVRTPVSYHANGKSGALTRIVNPLLGGHMVFCVDRFDASSTMGQLDLRTAATIVENMKKLM